MEKKMILRLSLIVIVFALMGGSYMLGRKNGVKSVVAQIETIKEESVTGHELTEWEIFQLAMIKTESEFNQYAKGSSNDLGIFQITPIYVAEVNRLLGKRLYNPSDAYSIEKSLEMFTVIQNKHNPDFDIEKAIKIHNPGGNAIGYSKKIYSNIAFIKQMEQIRKELVLFNNINLKGNKDSEKTNG